MPFKSAVQKTPLTASNTTARPMKKKKLKKKLKAKPGQPPLPRLKY